MKKIMSFFLLFLFAVFELSGADLKQGIEYYKNKSYKKAKEIFLEIIKNDTKNYTAYYYLGVTSMILGDNDNAVLALQRAIEVQPERVEPYIELAEIYLNTEHYDLAEKYCSYAMQNDKKENDRYYYIRARIYYEKGDYNTAKILYQKACKINPENASYYNYIGLTYLKLNKSNIANTAFLQAVALDTNTYFFYFNLGLSFQNLSNWKRAADSYAKCLKLNSKFSNAKVQMNWVKKLQRIDDEKKRAEKSRTGKQKPKK